MFKIGSPAKLNNGFTILELLIVIGLVIISVSIASPIYSHFYTIAQLDDDSMQLVQNLRNIREFSVSGLNDSSYGIYFNNISNPERYIIFRGLDYNSRDINYDRVVLLGKNISLTQVFPNNQISFSRGLGLPNDTGNIVLFDQIENKQKTINVNQLGVIDIVN